MAMRSVAGGVAPGTTTTLAGQTTIRGLPGGHCPTIGAGGAKKPTTSTITSVRPALLNTSMVASAPSGAITMAARSAEVGAFRFDASGFGPPPQTVRWVGAVGPTMVTFNATDVAPVGTDGSGSATERASPGPQEPAHTEP